MFFTYVYKHPITLEPFYVGKGKNSRHLSHINRAFKKRKGKIEGHSVRVCRRLIKRGLVPIIEKVLETAIEQDAFNEEVRLIALYKRIVDGGTLTNLTLGGEGASGLIQSTEHIAKRVKKLLGKKRTQEQRQRMSGKRAFSENVKLASIKRANRPEENERVSKQFKDIPIPETRKHQISATMKARGIKPLTVIRGCDHPKVRAREIKMPNGEIRNVPCLVEFCREHRLNLSTVRNTLSQHRPLKRGLFAGLQLLT